MCGIYSSCSCGWHVMQADVFTDIHTRTVFMPHKLHESVGLYELQLQHLNSFCVHVLQRTAVCSQAWQASWSARQPLLLPMFHHVDVNHLQARQLHNTHVANCMHNTYLLGLGCCSMMMYGRGGMCWESMHRDKRGCSGWVRACLLAA